MVDCGGGECGCGSVVCVGVVEGGVDGRFVSVVGDGGVCGELALSCECGASEFVV